MKAEPLKILLVEDEAIVAMMTQTHLEARGHSVVVAATGAAAVQCASQAAPDVVIMDVHLTGTMDGIEAASQMQREGEVPVIFVTGYADAALRQRAAPCSPVAYLVKPVSMQDIIAALECVPR